MIEIRGMALFGLFLLLLPAFIRGQSDDPCGGGGLANAERRICYSKADSKLSAEVEFIVKDWTAQFRRDAADRTESTVAADEFQKAAVAMISSQRLWKRYRQQHCNAVAHSWTTGSGAGTAYAACRYRLARERLAELKAAFR